MSFLEYIFSNIGKRFESPRKELKHGIPPQGFTIEKIDNEKQFVILRFDGGNPIYLHFWRFQFVINILKELKGNYIMVGSRVDPKKSNTIESKLYEEAKNKDHPSKRLRTAPFVCDILVLCGLAEYSIIRNRGRLVQAIHARASRAAALTNFF